MGSCKPRRERSLNHIVSSLVLAALVLFLSRQQDLPVGVRRTMLVLGLLSWLFLPKSQKPQYLHCGDSVLMKRISVRLAKSVRKFKPPLWLSSAFCQTVLCSFLSTRGPHLGYWREIVPVSADSEKKHAGFVALDWVDSYLISDGKHAIRYGPDSDIVVLLPGLTGDSGAHYIRQFSLQLSKAGYRVCCFNYRGSSCMDVPTPQLYDACYTADIRQACNRIHSRYPNSRIFGVGFSLGANLLTRYLGEEGDGCFVTAAVCVSSPYDIFLCSHIVHLSWLRTHLYSRPLAGFLKQFASKHRDSFHGRFGIDYARLDTASTLREVDREFTAKAFGYRTVDEYYRASVSTTRIMDIRVPTAFLSALDDPICDNLALPLDEIEANPCAMLVLTNNGGHGLQLFDGPLGQNSWSCEFVQSFFDAVLQDASQARALARTTVKVELSPTQQAA